MNASSLAGQAVTLARRTEDEDLVRIIKKLADAISDLEQEVQRLKMHQH